MSASDSITTTLVVHYDISINQACDIIDAVEEIDWSDRHERTRAWRAIQRIVPEKSKLEEVFFVLKKQLATPTA